MNGLRIHTLDDLEVLAQRLADRMAEAPLPPLTAETIIVQSQGMARWLHQFLARAHGIAASLHTPFPATFLQRLAEVALDRPRPAVDLFAVEPMTWRIHRLLAARIEHPEFEPLRRYLADDPDQRKGVQLAGRIAATFEQYNLYRPEMLLGWLAPRANAGMLPFGEPLRDDHGRRHPHRDWQRALWRSLCAEGQDHGAAPLSTLLDQLGDALRGPADPLPEGSLPRVAVFGVSHLPPALLDLLVALARHRPVDLYLMLPPGERQRDAHPLVERFGRQGDELWELLWQRDPEGMCFEDVHGDVRDAEELDALGVIQQDLRDLVDRGPDRGPGGGEPDALPRATPLPARPDDHSLSLHVCHNPRREVEVLRDQILAAFDELPDLTPADVLVLVPDVDTYAPHLVAVFDQAIGERALPLTLADRSQHTTQQVFAAFRQVLHTLRSRMERGDLLALLDPAPVRQAFGLTLDDVAVLHDWLDTLSVRWGLDGEWRAREFDVPAEQAHSLQRGLDRMLLGLCTGSQGPSDTIIAGMAPFGEATTSRAELLGRVAQLASGLRQASDRARTPKPWQQWHAVLHALLEEFVAPVDDGDEDALRTLRELLAEITAAADAAEHEEPLPFSAVVETVEERLENHGQGHGFLTGGITACALRPMRSIPFRVIAMAGLNDDRFPRSDKALPFDLMPGDRRRGDRSTRDDDRQLFLETLLAARDRLVLTYTGYSARDGSERPPSLCVAELMDHVDRSFVHEGGSARKLWTTSHPLHGFVAEGEPERFTYDAVHPVAEAPPLVAPAEPLPEWHAPDRPMLVSLAALQAFWGHPQRWFCREVLGLRVPPADDPLAGAEPFLFEPLERFQVRSTMLEHAQRATSPAADPLEAWWRASDALPHGDPGVVQLDRLRAETAPLTTALQRVPRESIEVDLTVPELGVRLVGTIDGVDERGGRLQARAARLKAKDELRAWLDHLVLALRARDRGEEPAVTQVLGIGAETALAAVDDPCAALRPLLAGWRYGQDRAAPYFVRSSAELAERALDSGDRNTVPLEAVRAWRRRFDSDPPKDGDDPWVRYVYRDAMPLDPVAVGWACAVWEPLLAARLEVQR